MITLLTHAGTVADDSPASRFGGTPLVPAGFTWPTCAECKSVQQFFAQLHLSDGSLLTLFQCADDPGRCDAWDPASGANSAWVFAAADLRPADVPAAGVTHIGEISAIDLADPVEVPDEGDGPFGDYVEAIAAWRRSTGRPREDVLGQWGGHPPWIQNDETPSCPGCATRMTFVAAPEEGHDSRTGPNFGTGYGYVFHCAPCRRAAFLFQC